MNSDLTRPRALFKFPNWIDRAKTISPESGQDNIWPLRRKAVAGRQTTVMIIIMMIVLSDDWLLIG